MKVKDFMIAAAVLLMTACSGSEEKKPVTRSFPQVQVPGVMTTQEDVMGYLAVHYWDALLDTSSVWLNDSLHINGVPKGEVEQAMANYIAIAESSGLATARRGMRSLYSKLETCGLKDTSSTLFDSMVSIVGRYLYDPNSPMRNEDIYQPFAQALSGSPLVDGLLREKYAGQARKSSLNCVGTKAADFSFSDRYGKTGHLYGIDAEYTLVFFVNPGCPACREIIQGLSADELIGSLISSGRLAVLDIYIDEDIAAWYESVGDYPLTWNSVYDHNLSIRSEELYDVRAIPSLYLLDSEKTVLLKDAVPEKILEFIHAMGE